MKVNDLFEISEWDNVPFQTKTEEKQAKLRQVSSVEMNLHVITMQVKRLGYERIQGSKVREPDGWESYVITKPENESKIRFLLKKHQKLRKEFDRLMKQAEELDASISGKPKR